MKHAIISSLAFLSLFWAAAANATIALVQQNDGSTSNTTVGVSFAASANCTTGNLVVLIWSAAGAGTVAATSVSNLGNAVWTKALSEVSSNGGSSEIWATTCGSTPGSSSTITYSVSTSTFWNMSEWSGATATQDSGSPTGSTTSYIAPSMTTTNANDLLIAVAGTSSGTPTIPGSWTAFSNVSAFHPGIYQIVSSTGTYSAFTAGGSGSTQSSAFAAFKATAAATGLKGFFIP